MSGVRGGDLGARRGGRKGWWVRREGGRGYASSMHDDKRTSRRPSCTRAAIVRKIIFSKGWSLMPVECSGENEEGGQGQG